MQVYKRSVIGCDHWEAKDAGLQKVQLLGVITGRPKMQVDKSSIIRCDNWEAIDD